MGRTAARTTPGLTVLVADPSPDNAETLALVLDACGHRAATAGTVAAALGAAAADGPDVLITEVLFPDGDGFELAGGVGAGRARRPLLILLTGRSVAADAVGRAGFDAHFLKPADPAALVKLLADHARQCRP
jgi:CheY-like chemotaxis protein